MSSSLCSLALLSCIPCVAVSPYPLFVLLRAFFQLGRDCCGRVFGFGVAFAPTSC
ncbi:hypothetical protein K435DRAFT_870942 [Dendrothele bispora CBS 962.96]|uniref:Hydrophobin n=1 Tax=Dendrothele bispora (strain CBS 962.96) TaxID=1314807 RepID=A0A4S8L5C2_DENBC|nr:hypothetical protein K435DRAFT_870942 [Dendrothele bispora CBS 962.96]